MKKLSSFLSSALIVQDARWSAIRSQVQGIIPALSYDLHKGEMGRVGVIGGSKDYTGAPFYAAKASLLFGADLVFVFCEHEALLPLKAYSPEFMVTALYETRLVEQQQKQQLQEEDCEEGEANAGTVTAVSMVEKLRASLWRLHVLVMGPGLGRWAACTS